MLVFEKTKNDHDAELKRVFEKINKCGLSLNLKKCVPKGKDKDGKMQFSVIYKITFSNSCHAIGHDKELPVVLTKYPTAHKCLPQYFCLSSGNSCCIFLELLPLRYCTNLLML